MDQRDWRMRFRERTGDEDRTEKMRQLGIAALGFWDEKGNDVVKDCSKIPVEEYLRIWRRKWPNNVSGRNSLKYVAYDMKRGDVIYAASGKYIVDKGIVNKECQYDPKFAKKNGFGWHHIVRVKWERWKENQRFEH